MNPIESIHERFHAPRRVRVLAGHLAELLPRGVSVLDVGTGDGRIAAAVARRRPDVEIRGIEDRPRPGARIPVEPFDGRRIPFPPASFDAVTFIDVLHHAQDPLQLLREGIRVGRRVLIVKDHTCDGLLALPTLRLMDRVGNRRFGIPPAADYWTERRWRRSFDDLGLGIALWRKDLGLYPWPVRWLCERSLHCLALLEIPDRS